MRKFAAMVMVVLVVVSAAGCYVGPNKLTCALDDWAQKGYGETPWLYGNVISATLIAFAHWVAGAVDGIVNMYYFWAKDAQPFGSGKGTTHIHTSAPSAK